MQIKNVKPITYAFLSFINAEIAPIIIAGSIRIAIAFIKKLFEIQLC